MRAFRIAPIVLLGAFAVACVADVNDLTAEERAMLGEEFAEEYGELQQDLQACDYDKQKADRLGTTARSGAGARSKGLCYRYVKRHLQNAGFKLPSDLWSTQYGASAADFVAFGNRNPEKLREMGFSPIAVRDGEKPPKGAIVVWGRGMCGYSPRHGHIEVVCNDDGSEACSDFRGRLRTKARCANAAPSFYAPTGTCRSADTCDDKEDGYYCSGINEGSAYECRGKTRSGSAFCAGQGANTKKYCGEPNSRANISNGQLVCTDSAPTGDGGASSSSGGGTDPGSSGGTDPGSSSGGTDPGSSSGGSSSGGTSGSSPGSGGTEGDSGEQSSQEGAWSCNGTTGTTIPRDGRYWMTSFGASDATSGEQCDDPNDNCIGACNKQASEQGFCTDAEISRPAICERNAKWFVADADRYGCGSRVRVDHDGKAVVALVIDKGPHCRIERGKGAAVLDASPAVNEYLTGRNDNGVGEAQVTVTEVVGTTPLGPVE